MKIKLYNGMETEVDEQEYPALSQFGWIAATSNYGVAYVVRRCKVRHTNVSMHREIIGAAKGQHVDHVNGNTLDNRRSNLRIVTQQENNKNKKRYLNNVSGVTGVSWNKQMKMWVARISVDRKDKYLGYYFSFEKAVAARKAAEIKYGFISR